MEIIKTGKTTKTHHTVIVDGVPYFRNEEFEYNSRGELVRQICDWYVGDKDGKGPYDRDWETKYQSVIRR